MSRGSTGATLQWLALAGGFALVSCADMGERLLDGNLPPIEACSHFVPFGWDLRDDSAVVVREDDRVVQGRISRPIDPAGVVLSFTFYDQDSLVLEPPGDECLDHWLEWSVGDTAVAAISNHPQEKWGIRLRAKQDGTTFFRIFPIHAIEGTPHHHYESREVVVQVGDGGAGFAFTGLRLTSGGEEIARERHGAVRGAVELRPGALSVPLDIELLEANGRLVPRDQLRPNSVLAVETGDPTIARVHVVGGDPWTMQIEAVGAGVTNLTARLTRGGLADFVSTTVPIRVTAGGAPGVAGMAFRQNCVLTTTYGWDAADLETEVTGLFRARPDQVPVDYRIELLGEWSEEAGRRDLVELDPDEWSLYLEGTKPQVAAVEAVEDAEGFVLRVRGQGAGTTSVRLWLQQGDVLWSPTAPIPIEVAPDPALDPDFILKKNGVWTVIRRGGVFGEACGTVPDPGWMEVEAGHVSEHFVFRLLNEACLQIPGDDEMQSLEFEFGDPCVARALTYPEHAHAGLSFHLEGLAAGETTLRLRFLDQGVTRFVTPAVPVRVRLP
ncbi:MAG: hypothetical protein IT349_17855 [Candidatus Eisenbacteria bacterium]|nr:hypothetical protein [Candidatus Eisenbacteria bacterium]